LQFVRNRQQIEVPPGESGYVSAGRYPGEDTFHRPRFATL
jgi:hypothetical protein